MIFDWYRGGDWGGIPVCRLGHIMADLVNVAYETYDYIKASGSYTAPQFKRGNGNIILFTSAPNAAASWWDGLPVSSDIIRHNYREALDFLDGMTDELTELENRFVQDDFETVVTAEYLGIADLDENTLERPHQAWVWAALRTAFERCRYLRRSTFFSGTVNQTVTTKTVTEPDLGPSPDFYTAPINEALALAWGSASYSEEYKNHLAITLLSFVSGFYAPVSAYNPTPHSSGTVTRNASVTFEFRGSDDDMLDLPVMASKLTFAKSALPAATPSQNSINTSEGVISDGTELSFGYAVESVTIDLEETTPFYLPDGSGSTVTSYWGYNFRFSASYPCWAVYDLHDDEYEAS